MGVRVLFGRGLVLALALGIWEAFGRQVHAIIFVPPSVVGVKMLEVLRLEVFPEFPSHIALTLWEVAAAYGLAIGVGVTLGFSLGLKKTLEVTYEPLLSTFYAVPNVVWYPLLMLLIGLGAESKIAFGFILGFFPIVLAVLSGVRQVDPQFLRVARSVGATTRQIFMKIILPASASTIVSGLRVGLALAIIGVVVAEILGSRAGIGYLISTAYGLLRTADFLALVVITIIIAVVINALATYLENRVKARLGEGEQLLLAGVLQG